METTFNFSSWNLRTVRKKKKKKEKRALTRIANSQIGGAK
jgi:hypothetical protein